jgi:regulator of protease activity HflC (stomatin/prohibitin superfamily)
MVPTSAVTIDWASSTETRPEIAVCKTDSIVTVKSEKTLSEKAEEFFKFSQLRVTSKDGFQLNVDVRMVIRIHPANAAFVIARFGSVANLIEQIVHPLIDSSFRNNAGEKKAIEFVHSRSDLQKEALERAREEFEKYNVEAQNLLIAYIDVDKSLLDTQTRKEIAIQQQAQYAEEASAQEKLIAVREKSARAEKQKDVIEAKLSVDINADKAAARIKEAEGTKQVRIIESEGTRQATIFSAEGTKQATILEADGNAYKSETEGKGTARAYEVQIKTIGKDNVFMLKLIEEIATGKIKIVPDVQVSGGEGAGGIIGAALGKMLQGKPATSDSK